MINARDLVKTEIALDELGVSNRLSSLENNKQIWTVGGVRTVNGLSPDDRGNVTVSPGISSVAWGEITGTLSNQTDLQAALDAKVATTRTLTAGTGLTGGGDLSADRSFALSAGSIASLALADSALQDITGEPLSDLSDVTITSIASGELLKWNGTAWINNTLAEAGIAAVSQDVQFKNVTVRDTAGNGTVTALSSDAAEYVSFYHTGTFGQLESSSNFVMTAPDGVRIVGLNNPQLLVQYGDGSFRSLGIYHNDTDATLTNNATGGNVDISTEGALRLPKNGIAVTSTQTLLLANNTASTDSVTQQWSPAQDFLGHAWISGLTNEDRTQRFRNELQTVTDAVTTSANLVWKSSIDTGTASFTDRMVLNTAGQLQLPTVGSPAGLLLGGDAHLYRGDSNRLDLASGDSFRITSGNLEFSTTVALTSGASNRLDLATGDSLNLVSGHITINGSGNFLEFPDASPFLGGVRFRGVTQIAAHASDPGNGLRFNYPTVTATSGSGYAVRLDPILNPGANASSANFRTMWWFQFIQGSNNLTGLLAGQEASIVMTNTATVSNLWGNRVGILNNSTGTLTFGVGYMPSFTSASGGHVTQLAGYAFGLSTSGTDAGTVAYSANGQSRFGMKFGSMPDPGAFTGTSTAVIWMMGTGGARDGFVFRNHAATNLYAPANSHLKTDAKFETLDKFAVNSTDGVSGSFSTASETVTVVGGIITAIEAG